MSNFFEQLVLPKKSEQLKQENLPTTERPETKIPMVDVTVEMCEPLFSEEKEESIVKHKDRAKENLRFFLEEYFSEAIANADIYESPALGASFLYTKVSLQELAQSLYKKIGSPRNEGSASVEQFAENSQKNHRPRKEFIFGTMFNVSSAHAFHWVEHAMDQLAKKLPDALQALACSEAVEDYEVYGMGNPGGEFGNVSDKFLQQVRNKPFERSGRLYAEFISSLTKNTNTEIDTWGVSMGSLMAMTTASSLVEQGNARQLQSKHDGVVQDFQEMTKQKTPIVRVKMQSPVGLDDSKFQSLQIKLGFAASLIESLATDPYARKVGGSEKVLKEITAKKLREKGIEPVLSAEELKRKEQLIKGLLDEMFTGMTIPVDLRVDMISGWRDPLVLSYERYLEMEKKNWEGHQKTLGGTLLKRVEGKENQRRFGNIQKGHDPAVIRLNYLKRLTKLAERMSSFSA